MSYDYETRAVVEMQLYAEIGLGLAQQMGDRPGCGSGGALAGNS
jgi:hypothetical protein